MKRLFILFLLVTFIASSLILAKADVLQQEPAKMVNISERTEPRTVNQHWVQVEKYIYRTVNLIYENDADDPGDDVTVQIRPAVAKIVYKFCGTWSTISQCYTGGQVLINGDWPKYLPISNQDIRYPLNVAFGTKNYPAQATVTASGSQYHVDIVGGTYQISYCKDLIYDEQGIPYKGVETTDTLIHSLQYTGSNPNQ